MRLLTFSESFWPRERGGAGRVAGDIARELHRRGHVLDVICPDAVAAMETEPLAPGLTVHRMPAGDGAQAKQLDYAYTPRMAGEAFEYLRAQVPLSEVAVFHDNGGFFQNLLPLEALLLEAMPQALALLQFQIQYRPLFAAEGLQVPNAPALIAGQRRLAQLVRAQPRHAIAFLSRAERDEGLASFQLGEREGVHLVPNAIPMDRYAGLDRCVPLWEMNGPPRIALAGRLGAPMKGLDLALRGLAAIAHKADFVVQLIGHQPQTECLPAALAGRIQSTGWLDARGVADALHGCAAFLMPSRYEPFGLLALEAHAVMCPVIASDTGGLRDIIVHGETGLLCDPAQVPEEIARHTLALLRDNDLREDLTLAAYGRLRERYTLGTVCDQLEALFQG